MNATGIRQPSLLPTDEPTAGTSSGSADATAASSTTSPATTSGAATRPRARGGVATIGSATPEELARRLDALEKAIAAERLRHAVIETFLVDENHRLRRSLAELLQRWEPETWAEIQRKAEQAAADGG